MNFAKTILSSIAFLLFVCGVFVLPGSRGFFSAPKPDFTGMQADLSVPILSGGENGAGAVLPEFEAAMAAPEDGTGVELQLKAPNADEVFFYAQGRVPATVLHIGKALPGGEGIWKYKLDFNGQILPNGIYDIRGRIYRGGKIYDSPSIRVEIGNQTAADGRNTAIAENIRQSNQAIVHGREVFQQSIRAAADGINAKTGNGQAESIAKIADIVAAIKQLGYSLEKFEERRSDIGVRVRRLEDDIVNFPENVLQSIKNEKLNELENHRNEIRQIDAKIAADKEGLEQKIAAKRNLAGLILTAAAGDEGVGRILADLENEISRQEEENIKERETLLNDTDGDDLADDREIQTGADPLNPDTDGDGALDGDEISRGYDPLKPNEFAKTDFYDPRLSPPLKTDIYGVEKVETIKLGDGSLGIRFEGRALPTAFAAIYIYSVPIVSMVKADASGRWTYVLDRALADGQHSVYAVLSDIAGEIVARSEEFVFIKAGASVARTTTDKIVVPLANVQEFKSDFIFWAVFSIVLSLAAAIAVIGLAIRRSRESAN
ncbi:MAG: Ig-like domain-containing protein [Minisyncoccales bacterium]